MISVKKNYSKIPSKLLSPECLLLIKDAVANRGKHKYNSNYYGLGCKAELELLYNNKCCFCQSDPSPSAYWQVEHFRPKGISPKKTIYGNHSGYYWLGYEWSNLLLVCEKCNKKKSSHFPISNEESRLTSHQLDGNGNLISLVSNTLYKDEGHLLLNPEIDTVEDYLIFKPDGDIKGIDQTGRGELSISLYNLRREKLVLARRKIVDDFFDEIKETLVRYNKSEINEQSLKDILNIKFTTLKRKSNDKRLEYSRVWYFMFFKFEIFASSYLFEKSDYDLVKRRFDLFNERLT